MKLNNDFMRLLIEVDGKLFAVTHICNSLDEANKIMSENPQVACIAEDEQGRIYLAEKNPS
jgi:hypothetical protein